MFLELTFIFATSHAKALTLTRAWNFQVEVCRTKVFRVDRTRESFKKEQKMSKTKTSYLKE